MMVTEVAVEAPWSGDWQHRVEEAVLAAVRATPHGDLTTIPAMVEISVRLTSDDDVHALNKQYRQQDKPTNVLSFPMVQPDLIDGLADTDDGEVLLGDIVLAHGVCEREAHERGVAVADHATHLIVHGVLHLLGYDHMTDAEADAMESIERDVLAGLGLHDPYSIED